MLARDTLAVGPSKRACEESPQWDIECGASLVLGDEESDLGAPGLGLGLEEDAGADVDVDMDIAPALRAKRCRA
jgi:hypothetical protein